MINFTVTDTIATFDGNEFPVNLVEFEIEGGVLAPKELGEIEPPQIDGSKGVVLSGRGPIWLFATLSHHYHVSRWVATFDPRVVEGGGAVVTSTHALGVPPIGSIVSVPKFE